MKAQNAIDLQPAWALQELDAIAKQIRSSNKEAANDSWSDTAITFSFSVGPAGGNLQGWITYYDVSKINFKLKDLQQKTGIAAGTGEISGSL